MMKRLLWIILLVLSGTVCSQQIEVDIIQQKLNRLYFSAGMEAGIGVGAEFVVDCPDREPYNGTIEYSGPGVSYSAPIPDSYSLAIDSLCTAMVTIAEVDSQANVVIGTDLPVRFFDLDHEPLFVREADTISMNLVDSARVIGSSATVYLRSDLRFSDGSPLNAEELRRFLIHLHENSRSYLARYFFAKLRPIDSGGVELIDGSTVRMNFYHPFPRVCYFLSHPDFAIYNGTGHGTTPFVEIADREGTIDDRIYGRNPYYRGHPTAAAELIVRQFEQQYRMTFAFENGELDAIIRFGFEGDLAGTYEAKALYPETIAMISGIGRELFSGGMFTTSLYYSFNPLLGHLYFQYGDIKPVHHWLPPPSGDSGGTRYYPFDILKGKQLFSSITPDIDSALLVYDNTLVYTTADYLADIAAREGMMATNRRYYPGIAFDVRVACFPASDDIMPFSLLAAILELNDQNSAMPPGERLERPGWDDAGRGSQMYDTKNRRTFFSRAEEMLFSEAGFFPLYRPYIFAIPAAGVSGIEFDFYGYPDMRSIEKLKTNPAGPPEGSDQ